MNFDFTDSGTGPALLFLPGSYSNHAAWKGICQALKGRYRLIATSLPGYGGSPEIRIDHVNDMSMMSGFVADVVARVGKPVHLIGHSFGGHVAYAAVLSGKVAPLSLVSFEGNPIFAQQGETPFSWKASMLDMVQRFEEAFALGDPDAAAIIIDFWSKRGVFEAMPEAFQDYCRSCVYTNILDWRCASKFTTPLSEYSAIDVPCTIVRGEFANQAIVDISDGITRAIADSSLKIVAKSNHFLISTHPHECAKIIDAHMNAYLEQN